MGKLKDIRTVYSESLKVKLLKPAMTQLEENKQGRKNYINYHATADFHLYASMMIRHTRQCYKTYEIPLSIEVSLY